ncbi:hypothetical protein, partial [Burkholderia cenocepacia]|uniref:hypothetical protein n=1 Tax=Burkholderia cenocepacia TaxID=95486 RepID=UPI00403F4912
GRQIAHCARLAVPGYSGAGAPTLGGYRGFGTASDYPVLGCCISELRLLRLVTHNGFLFGYFERRYDVKRHSRVL